MDKLKQFSADDQKALQELLDNFLSRSDVPTKCRSQHWLQSHSPSLLEFKSNDKTGKWCIFVSEKTVDAKWLKIKEALAKDELLIAKVSTQLHKRSKSAKYVICVYTKDWSDKEDLQKSREVLRKLGFNRPLKYKRDIETINGVYNAPDEFYLVM